MGGQIAQDQRERRINLILSFIFLFRFVTKRDLRLFGSALLRVKYMRRTMQYILKNKTD